EQDWDIYWYRKYRGNNYLNEIQADDSNESFRRSFPMLSLFDRLPPVKSGQQADRFEIRRRGARRFDVSHAVGAGALIVLAQATTPLPVPLTVEGDKPEGTGTTFYQYVLPIDRSAVEHAPEIVAATTQASSSKE